MSKHFESNISGEPFIKEVESNDIKKNPTEIVDEYFDFLKKYWNLEKTWNGEHSTNDESCPYYLFEHHAKNKLFNIIKDL